MSMKRSRRLVKPRLNVLLLDWIALNTAVDSRDVQFYFFLHLSTNEPAELNSDQHVKSK